MSLDKCQSVVKTFVHCKSQITSNMIRFVEFNRAMITKQNYRVFHQPHSLMSQFVLAKYGKGSVEDIFKVNSSSKWRQRAVLRASDFLIPTLQQQVGSGDSFSWDLRSNFQWRPITFPSANKVGRIRTTVMSHLGNKTCIAQTKYANGTYFVLQGYQSLISFSTYQSAPTNQFPWKEIQKVPLP